MNQCFFFHKWSKWETYEQPMVFYSPYVGVEGRKYNETKQRRKCARCGLEEQRKV